MNIVTNNPPGIQAITLVACLLGTLFLIAMGWVCFLLNDVEALEIQNKALEARVMVKGVDRIDHEAKERKAVTMLASMMEGIEARNEMIRQLRVEKSELLLTLKNIREEELRAAYALSHAGVQNA